MEVRQIMSSHVITVGQDEPVAAAARLLKGFNLGALPVCDNAGRLRGVVTDRDIVLRCIALENDPQTTRVSEIMTRGVFTAAPTDTAEQVSRVMAREQVRRLPVTDGGRVVGMVSLSDLARREDLRMECADAMGRISSNVSRRS